jgi:hypothetical protein
MSQDLTPDGNAKLAHTSPEDRALDCRGNPMKARLYRYRAFEWFQTDALTRLPRLFNQLGEGRFYRDYYNLCVAPGGAMGGHDQRTMQVFFGQRPFDFTFLPRASDRSPV